VSVRPGSVALLGGGVIGAGWAARFVLNGCDVRLYDPAPDASARATEVLADLRDTYATTLEEGDDDEYRDVFNRAVLRRWPPFALELEDR